MYASGVGKLWHSQLLCFLRNFVYRSHYKIKVSPGCLNRCLRDPLVALISFIYLLGSQVGYCGALHHQEGVVK